MKQVSKSYCGKYIYKAVLFNQQMISQVEKYIYEALYVSDNALRRKAEAYLFTLANQSCTEFFTSLAYIIADNNKKREMRQAACTVFSRLVSFKLPDNRVYWDNVLGNKKNEIKEMLLSTLILNDALIVKGGANAIANIASVEIPRGEWLDIVITLAQNTQHEEFSIRKASVLTLGYICQQLKNMKQTINNHVSCQQILGGLLMSLQKESQIVQIALQALRDSIPFLKSIFMQQIEYSNKMFQFIIPILTHNNYRQRVYQILFEFSKYCYELLENYLGLIIDFTTRHIQSRNDDAKLALSLWQTIGTQYLQRKEEKQVRLNAAAYELPNYAVLAHKTILPEVMGCIIILNQRDLEFEQMRVSAINTLTALIECGTRQMVEIVTDGVSRVLLSQNPGQRQASVPLFSCLCNYQDKEDIENRFKLGFNHLYGLLHDPTPLVVKNTLHGFQILSEVFPHVFMMNSQIKEIIFHLLGMAKSRDQEINLMALTILNNITEVLKEFPDPIARQPQHLITEVVKMFDANLQENTNKQAGEKLIILLMNIIMFTDQLKIVNQLVEHLIQQYKHYASINILDKHIVLEHIVTVLHTCLLALGKSIIPNIQHKEQIFMLINNHINLFGVQAEGLNLISAAATCYKKQFQNDPNRYWNTIMHGLSLIDQKVTFKAAISCISDISRIHQTGYIQKLNLVFQKLVQYMHENIDRDLKTEILKCFGDLSLGMKNYCVDYIAQILEIVDNCMAAVYLFEQNENEKLYAEELKQGLVQMYHCVVFSVNTQDRVNHQLANHFQQIAQFIVKTCDVKYKPTVDYLKNGLYLIFDSALFYIKNGNYKRLAEQVIDSNEIRKMVDIVKRYRDRPDVQELLIFIDNKVKGERR